MGEYVAFPQIKFIMHIGPDVDEDISVEGMLYGTPAPRPKKIIK
ncbi:MAG: hypothetical protein PH343_02435 [Nitrospira sp.]|nr:hypothetical protein [Nitrospira sp.]